MSLFYSDEFVTLYHSDALEWLPRFHDKAFALTVTDPPYNCGKNYGKNTDDRRDWKEWCEWIDTILDSTMRISEHGTLMLLSQPAYRKFCRFGSHEITWSMAWVKPMSGCCTHGAFMPHWEHIAYWGDYQRKKNADKNNGCGWGADVIEQNVDMGHGRRETGGHPTPKPIGLMRQLLRRLPAGPICDPFAGSGQTLIAAKEQGRKAYGCEIEAKWCKLIADRLAQILPLQFDKPEQHRSPILL